MMVRFALLLSLYCYPQVAHGFLPSWMPGAVLTSAPELKRYINQQETNTTLDVRLTIGLTKSDQFVIDGLQFKLCSSKPHDSTVPLPGANGPRPWLSNGVHEIEVLKDGTFINMEGLQNVELRYGVWEMIWRDNAPAGVIICGFSLDKDAIRNDAILEKGQLYLTWPVWSNESLEEQQKRKAQAEIKYKEFENERDTQLEKMINTPNILKKALHFRNAAAATEQMDYTGLHYLVDVPSGDDVLEIGDGLKMVKSGTVWSKTGSFSETFRASRQQLLGSATLH